MTGYSPARVLFFLNYMYGWLSHQLSGMQGRGLMEKKRLIPGSHLLQQMRLRTVTGGTAPRNWVFICGRRRKSPDIRVCSCFPERGNSGKNLLGKKI